MSTKENDIWLENIYEKFKATTDGRDRAFFLHQLRSNGFKEEAENLVEDWHEERYDYLKDRGVGFAELLSDEDGEFFLDETDNGNPGEDGYEVRVSKHYLPDHLNVEYWSTYTYPWHAIPKYNENKTTESMGGSEEVKTEN